MCNTASPVPTMCMFQEKSAAAVESQRQRRRTGLDTHHIDSLKERGVPSTDDSPKYNYTFQDGCYSKSETLF